MWPNYSLEAIRSVHAMLTAGRPLTAYRSNRDYGVPPLPHSWADRFERLMEQAFGVSHVVGVNSGTAALTAAIYALDLPKGSEILVTPYTFSASAAAIILCGHKPKFVDVNPITCCMDPDEAKRSMSKRVKAIVHVDLFGKLVDYAPLKALAVPIIQDNCQATGARVGGSHLRGVIACGSGNGGKNLPCGEAGWAYTNNAKYADRMRKYISHAENFDTPWVGVNGRMPELTACLAWHGLRELNARNQRRRELASILNERQYAHPSWHRTFDEPPGSHVYYVYPFTLQNVSRYRFVQRMAKRGIEVGEGYIQPPLHKYKAFKKYCRRRLPVVEELSKKSLCVLSCLTPDREHEFAHKVARAIVECL